MSERRSEPDLDHVRRAMREHDDRQEVEERDEAAESEDEEREDQDDDGE